MPPNISVIIPTFNRPCLLRNCLFALEQQTLPPGSFEVIVVDDGSQVPLSLDPAEWLHAFTLRVIRQENTGPSGARNRGAEAARGDILAFTDDDCLPIPEWLERLNVPLSEYPEALAGGTTYNGLRDNLYSETSQLIVTMVYEHFNRGARGAYFLASNNIACRRDAYLSCGGFDTAFPVAGAEDREFCDRWRMLHRPLLWISGALVEHRHTQTLRKFTNLHYRYGRGAWLYQAKRRLRNSGTMADDMGFHRSLIQRVSRKLTGAPLPEQVKISGLLMLWQFANAAGFAREAIVYHISRLRKPVSPRGDSQDKTVGTAPQTR